MGPVKIKGDLWVKIGENTQVNISASSPALLQKVEELLAEEVPKDPVIKTQVVILEGLASLS